MMKPEIKTKWVEALRSGKYKQCQGGLLRGNSYCCLGVLSDIYSKDTNNPFPDQNYNAVLQLEVQSWAGLYSENPDMKYKGSETWLSRLNDHDGLNFKELADLIEEQL